MTVRVHRRLYTVWLLDGLEVHAEVLMYSRQGIYTIGCCDLMRAPGRIHLI